MCKPESGRVVNSGGICVGVYTLWVAVYTNKKKLLHRLYTFIFRLYRSSKQLKTHRKRIISCFQQSKKCFSIFLTFFFGGVYCYPLVCVAVYTPHFPIFLKRFRCHHTPASKTTFPGFEPVVRLHLSWTLQWTPWASSWTLPS